MPERLPTVQVLDEDGAPLTLTFPLFGREVAFHVWRAEIGRVPLYLLDTELDENDPVDRWITARLYEGNPLTRLGQYGLLGIGAVRALRALGIEPGVLHFNEGHPALAALELAAERRRRRRRRLEDALAARARRGASSRPTPRCPRATRRTRPSSFLEAFADLPGRLGIDDGAVPRPLPHAPRERRVAGDDAARAAPLPPRERRQPAPRRGRARDVATALRRRVRPTTCRSRTSRTASTSRRSSRPPMRALLDRHLGRRVARPRVRPGDLGAGRRHSGRGALGGPQRGAPPARRLREGEVRAGPAAPRRGPGRRDGGRGDVRRGHADARLRAADRDVQAPVPAHVRPGARPPDLRRRAAAADGRGRQGASARRQREADARRRLRPLARRSASRPGSPSSRTTTSPSRRRSSAAATSGSTCRGRRSRRAGRAG